MNLKMDVRELGMDGLCRREGGKEGSESTEALIRFPLLGVDRGTANQQP